MASPVRSASISDIAVWTLSVDPPHGGWLSWQWSVRLGQHPVEEEVLCVKKHGFTSNLSFPNYTEKTSVYSFLFLIWPQPHPTVLQVNSGIEKKFTWVVNKELRRLADEEHLGNI